MKEGSTFGILDIYTKFEEHSFDREMKKQVTNVNEGKYIVKDAQEYFRYALEVASKMMQLDKVFVRADDEYLQELFD